MQQALAEPDTLDGFTWSSLMDIAKRILAAESGIFIAASADLPHEVATEIAVTGAPMIHVGHDQDADRVIEEAPMCKTLKILPVASPI